MDFPTNPPNQSGVADEPTDHDDLNTTVYIDALTNFIKGSPTPMTISIQGEWGSGKTSLVRRISNKLKDTESIIQIELDCWHYALIDSGYYALHHILFHLTDEIKSHSNDRQLLRKLEKSSRPFRIFLSRTVGAAGTFLPGGQILERVSQTLLTDIPSIKKLKLNLKNLIEAITRKDDKKFLIKVDNLDRIEPKKAVEILNLLNNVFTLRGCIFIILLDPEIIRTGVGQLFPDQESEFDSYFDKIIQLTFRMPNRDLSIADYTTKRLIEIGYIQEGQFDANKQQQLSRLIELTVGNNPRSIKRIVNSLSIIKLINDERAKLSNTENKHNADLRFKLLEFGIAALQNTYSMVYDKLEDKPNFYEWTKPEPNEYKFADGEGQTEDIDKKLKGNFAYLLEQSYKKRNRDDTGQEEWNEKAEEILQFFRYLEKDIYDQKRETFIDHIRDAVNETSVTNRTASRKNYSDEFKKAVAVALEEAKQAGGELGHISRVAETYGIHVNNVTNWHKRFYPEQQKTEE